MVIYFYKREGDVVIEWIRKYLVFIVVIFVGGLFFLFFDRGHKQDTTESYTLEDETRNDGPILEDNEDLDIEEDTVFLVDIKGAVKQPGVYKVETTDRVQDVISLAGGIKENADETNVNLAQKLQDEMVIYVPYEGEEFDNSSTIQHAGTTQTNNMNEDKVMINQATVEEIQTLNGIGPKKAEAIVSHREEHGPFETIDDLTNVSGIGEKTVDNLRDNIIVP